MTAHEMMGYDIPPDKPDSPCAACGSAMMGGGVRRAVVDDQGKSSLLMLCSNAIACASRYRRGLTPEGFAESLRIEVRLNKSIPLDVRWMGGEIL